MPKGNQSVFPTIAENYPASATYAYCSPGMDLRTYIATHAMAGLLAGYNSPESSKAAEWAVAYADALLAELEK